ncbi:iron ABC transporter permease [Subtercola boreus]|uniref:Iron ABC transporter permease n=1 Tax=Subtercola boreus TaxID=120213 RepID=A0A3E0VA96_9MICO|nr:iron ABC transporter permease [Subtercola boreus]RFA06525.1 iron ABC transporter permease [Subtercola boreus]TQL46823.1 iron(III) transport system permease protein [Subtercola boreus]
MAGRWLRSPLLVVVVVVLAAVMLLPVGYVVAIGFQVGWPTLAPLVFRPKVGELLVNTVLLVVLGVPVTVVLGVGGAWLVERTTLPGRRIWAVLLAAPLAIPAFVSSYGWVSAIPSIGGIGGGLLVATLAYYPLVYLPAVTTIRRLDPALEESARSLGLGSWRVFARVVLPQLRLAVWGGGLVVALHLLSEYGAFALIRFDTFTTAIVVQYQSTFAGPAASALGIVLAGLCLLLLLGESATRGTARYSRVGSGAARPAVLEQLGWATPLAMAGLVVVLFAALGVPIASLVRWLSVGDPWAQRELHTAILQTAGLAVIGAIVTVLVALPIAWLTIRHPGRLPRLLESAYYLASSLPAIIIALGLVTITIRIVPALYQSVFTVVLAYVIIFLPRALVSLRTGIAQAPVALEEAARSLGHSPLAARARVTLPLILPALGAGAALVGLGAANELTATLLLAPSGTRTLATQFWSASTSVAYSDAAPYALLLIALSLPSVAILFLQTRKRVR